MAFRLTKEIKKLIRNDNKLMAAYADAIGIQSTSIPPAFTRDTIGLITYPALKIISDYTGKPIEELIEEYEEDQVTAEFKR